VECRFLNANMAKECEIGEIVECVGDDDDKEGVVGKLGLGDWCVFVGTGLMFFVILS
jgi:hypothetical protein